MRAARAPIARPTGVPTRRRPGRAAVALACGALCVAACGAQVRPRPSARGVTLAPGVRAGGASAPAGRARRGLDAELLAVGQAFACARTVDGRVRCWGNNVAGQLGDGTTVARDGPVVVAGLAGASELAAGAQHACAIVDGAVSCWGDNEHGQLGDGTTEPHERPASVPALRGGAAQLALGSAHSCAAMDDGTVRCWGENLGGRLGNGGDENAREPVTVPGLRGVVRVAAGFGHTCALRADGAVFCWGDNVFGQLGVSVVLPRAYTPVRVPGLPPARDLSAAADQSCVVLAQDGSVRCWGLRHRDREPVYLADDPRAVLPGVRDVVQFSAGVLMSCALRVDRTVRCWGWFDLDDTHESVEVDVNVYRIVRRSTSAHHYAWYDGTVPGVRDATRVSVGDDHACALGADGEVLCWGANDFGQLGGARPASERPRLVTPAVRDVVELALGAAHSCARTRDGEVRCWGRNTFGELGRMTRTRSSPAPAPVAGLGHGGVAQLALGGGVSCARMDDGAVRCWGGDGGAWLGDGRPTRIDAASSAVPVAVRDVHSAAQLAVGAERACARLDDGRVRCWGGHPPRGATTSGGGVDATNVAAVSTTTMSASATTAATASAGAANGGAASGAPVALVPSTDIPGVLDAQEVAVGAAHACIRFGDGAVHCLGRNERGQLGDGTRRASALPVAAGVTDATQVAARGDHTCARLAAGGVVCWGRNDRGQLGDGTSTDRDTPTPVAGLGAGVAQIALGEAHACARMDDGTVRCWGANDAGQLGLEGGDAARVAWRESPAPVPGLSHVTSLALGRDHACALRDDGTVRCWGANDDDQLGDDRPPPSAIPVRVRWR